MIFTKEWLEKAGVRAIKTVAQTATATIGTSALISEVNWIAVASASAVAGLLSLLFSIHGLPELTTTTEIEAVTEVEMVTNLADLTVTELRALAKEYGIAGYSKMIKSMLIDAVSEKIAEVRNTAEED